MGFRWNDGLQTFDQWQAAGRDTTTAGHQLTQPEAVTDRGPDADPIVIDSTTRTTAPATTSTSQATATSAEPATSTAAPGAAAARQTSPATAAKPPRT